MDFNAFKQAVAAEAAAQGIREYELYYEREESTTVSAFGHEITEFSDSNEGGVCLRCPVNGHMGYASTESLSAESARALVRRAADNAAAMEKEEPEFLAGGGQSYETLPQRDLALPDAGALCRTALNAQDALYAQQGVVDGCESEVFAFHTQTAIVNTNGLDLFYENAASGAVLSAVVEGGGEKNNEYKISVGPVGSLDLAALAAEAADGARAKLGAGAPASGSVPVVFSPRAMAALLATYADVFSAENVQKGLSLLKDKEGAVIASQAVTLIDDPFYEKSVRPMPFDAEGTPARRKNVIEKGVLKTLLYNLSTAAAAGRETTGNAMKKSYWDKITVRPFTMRLAPGACGEEELLQRAGSGVYIAELNGMHAGANPISGDFSLQSGGFLIENGKKTAPVRSFTVAGNFFTLLMGVEAVADNVGLPESLGATAFISPSALVKGLSIAGK